MPLVRVPTLSLPNLVGSPEGTHLLLPQSLIEIETSMDYLLDIYTYMVYIERIMSGDGHTLAGLNAEGLRQKPENTTDVIFDNRDPNSSQYGVLTNTNNHNYTGEPNPRDMWDVYELIKRNHGKCHIETYYYLIEEDDDKLVFDIEIEAFNSPTDPDRWKKTYHIKHAIINKRTR